MSSRLLSSGNASSIEATSAFAVVIFPTEIVAYLRTLILDCSEERAQFRQKSVQILSGDIVPRVDLADFQARVGGLHLLHGLGRVHVRARAAQRKDGAAHLADKAPHVDAELRALAGLQDPAELVAEVRIPL